MNTFNTVQACTGRPTASARRNTAMRRIAFVGCLILGLCLSLWPFSSAHASGVLRTLTYRGVHPGHRYTFHLRARDHVDNWGAWVSASTQVR